MRAMALKRYSIFPEAPVISSTLAEGVFTPQQRSLSVYSTAQIDWAGEHLTVCKSINSTE